MIQSWPKVRFMLVAKYWYQGGDLDIKTWWSADRDEILRLMHKLEPMANAFGLQLVMDQESEGNVVHLCEFN